MSSKYLSNEIVFDTGPLIAFAHINWLGQLPLLFEYIYISEQVYTESQFEPEREDARCILDAVEVCKVIQLKRTTPNLEKYPGRLGIGEISGIELALRRRCAVVLDDRHARRYARKLNVPVVGTAGILISAKQKGLITSVTELLNILREKQYYFSDDLLKRIRQRCGE